jgi:hypothetical protein
MERHMRGLQRAGAGIALIVIMLAGCGGDSDDPGASGTGDDAQTSAPTTVPPEGTATDGDGFCAEVEGIRDRLENFDSLPDAADPEAAIETVIETMENSVDALRSVDPPAEIAEDWSTLTEAFDDVVTDLRNLDTSDPGALPQQLEDLSNRMEQRSTAIEGAGTRIDAYLKDECGIVLE